MIEAPEIGEEYAYSARGGFGDRILRVRVKGFRKNLVITEGVEDQRRRDVSRKRLED